jgi:hypothetical protein
MIIFTFFGFSPGLVDPWQCTSEKVGENGRKFRQKRLPAFTLVPDDT